VYPWSLWGEQNHLAATDGARGVLMRIRINIVKCLWN
jgi:hypothetical protein